MKTLQLRQRDALALTATLSVSEKSLLNTMETYIMGYFTQPSSISRMNLLAAMEVCSVGS